jgi:hypothetical protein
MGVIIGLVRNKGQPAFLRSFYCGCGSERIIFIRDFFAKYKEV